MELRNDEMEKLYAETFQSIEEGTILKGKIVLAFLALQSLVMPRVSVLMTGADEWALRGLPWARQATPAAPTRNVEGRRATTTTLAEAAADRAPPLLPVPLRGGGRAFGGALTWETPQLLAGFAKDGPFADLSPPADVFVRRQVLAEPGGETSLRTWASLADGTPLVTRVASGAGAIALFHVTATPEWSDLPLSTVFTDMLQGRGQSAFRAARAAGRAVPDAPPGGVPGRSRGERRPPSRRPLDSHSS